MYFSADHFQRQVNDHVHTEPRELVESYRPIVHQLKQQYTLVHAFQLSLSHLCQMNEEQATSLQEMRTHSPMQGEHEELTAQAEHYLISLEQLEGHVMQQRAQLEHIREVLQCLEADIADQEHILQAL